MTASIGIIGGTGALAVLPSGAGQREQVSTPYGNPSSPVVCWSSGETDFRFIARHGFETTIPPHRVNYRANVWALNALQTERIIAINAVGGIPAEPAPGRLVFPDQLIDYTWGREHTYADGIDRPLQHIDFTLPFSPAWREQLIGLARSQGLDVAAAGTYGVTQGPRLETPAEIDRLERDGCDIVGMTAMPEAALARELDLEYAICAVIVNRAAGRSDGGADLHAQMARFLDGGMDQVRRLLGAL